MRQVILAFEGTNFSESAFDFARQLNRVSPIRLTGILLPDMNLAGIYPYSMVPADGLLLHSISEEDRRLADRNLERFNSLCKENGISSRVFETSFDNAISELKSET